VTLVVEALSPVKVLQCWWFNPWSSPVKYYYWKSDTACCCFLGLWARTGLVYHSQSVWNDWVEYHVYLRHGTLVCWHFKIWLESVTVQQNFALTDKYSYELLKWL